MKIVLWAAAGCVLIALAAAFVILRKLFVMAFLRGEDVTRESVERHYADRPETARRILDSMDWIEAQPCEEMRITSFDGLSLYGRLIRAEHPKGVMLLAHGYHSSADFDFSLGVPMYHELGYDVLLIDERAQGRSEGKYIGYGVLESRDVARWAEVLAEKLGGEDVFLGGMSMGSAAVLMAAGLPLPENVRGIIADCGFTSPRAIFTSVLKSMKQGWLIAFLPAVNLVMRLTAGYGMDDADTRSALKKTALPVLLIHGTADTFVPCFMSEENYAANPDKCRLVLVEGADHGKSFVVDEARCRREVETFLRNHASKA